MKLKAWMIFVVGLIAMFAVSQFIEDPLLAGSLVGEYVLYGGFVLVIYYLIMRLKFWKNKPKQHDQLK